MAVIPGSSAQHALSEYACRQIQKYIILPIIREERLKNFHPLVAGLPYRVARKEITCLRDLEKVLLWLAPVSTDTPPWARRLGLGLILSSKKWSVSKSSFLLFCETSIQCIHTTVDYLNENDQRRPTDRPYNQGYFLDLVEQVRQYAGMLSASRAAAASSAAEHEGPRFVAQLQHLAYLLTMSSDERLDLIGGLSQTGKQAELVRIKDGKSISLRTGEEISIDDYKSGSKRAIDGPSEEDALRSMARRKKSAGSNAREEHRCRECHKIFKRPCDLTYEIPPSESFLAKPLTRIENTRKHTPGLGNVLTAIANITTTAGLQRRSVIAI